MKDTNKKSDENHDLRTKPELTILFCFTIALLITFFLIMLMRKFSSKAIVEEAASEFAIKTFRVEVDGVSSELIPASIARNGAGALGKPAEESFKAAQGLLNDNVQIETKRIAIPASGAENSSNNSSSSNTILPESGDKLAQITVGYIFIIILKMYLFN